VGGQATTFERYLISMDIPMIGRTASRELSRHFGGDLSALETAVDNGFDFTQLNDFGEVLHCNIHEWFRIEENRYLEVCCQVYFKYFILRTSKRQKSHQDTDSWWDFCRPHLAMPRKIARLL